MKKFIEGTFKEAYYNECEAGCPLGIVPKGKEEADFKASMSGCAVLCNLFKEALDLYPDYGDPKHALIGKKVKMTI